MKKNDLKTGYRVTLRNGEKMIVLVNPDTYFSDGPYSNSVIAVNPIKDSFGWIDFCNYKDDLVGFDDFDFDFDIVEVEKPRHPYDIFYHGRFESIWKREE